ncbi:MAG TPA: non-canonical purine NTP pyrophosphatase [Candidatus Saccharimonadales bacterium]|nr:non-canonical purine NTP pyrophosphatase [Candidatus Saccharimonadales bacterium]
MKDFVLITGNQNKADYLAMWLGMPVKHEKLDLDEIQSLDLRTIAEDKARRAFDAVNKPVLVEDVALSFTALGKLPGPLLKWFLEDIGTEGLCSLADGLENRTARAYMMYVLYDGNTMHTFEGTTNGYVADTPRGSRGFGFDPTFIPEGCAKTYAEMTDDEVKPYSIRYKAIEKLREFLQNS